MFLAALVSRSCTEPQSLHIHCLIPRPVLPLGLLQLSAESGVVESRFFVEREKSGAIYRELVAFLYWLTTSGMKSLLSEA